MNAETKAWLRRAHGTGIHDDYENDERQRNAVHAYIAKLHLAIHGALRLGGLPPVTHNILAQAVEGDE